jgi:hypothetical protein
MPHTTRVYSVWYQKPEFFRDGSGGVSWLQKIGKLPDPKKIEETHVHLVYMNVSGTRECALEEIFSRMQGEVWSPDGQQREFIESKGLQHTSMTVGDVIQCGDDFWLADLVGFKPL